jgi:hypothetical protein
LLGAVRWDGQKETAGPSTTLRSAQDDDSVGVSTKKPLNKLALIGHGPGLFSAAPLRLNSYVVFYTQTLKTVDSFKDNSFPQAGKPVPDSSDLRF